MTYDVLLISIVFVKEAVCRLCMRLPITGCLQVQNGILHSENA